MRNYDALVDHIYQIYYNSVSIQTPIGGGKLSFLILTVYPTMYATLSITHFVTPINPGPAPTIPPNSTGTIAAAMAID